MTYTASVTKQAQVTIPAALWKKYGLKGKMVVFEDLSNGEMKLRPVKDFMDLRGAFKSKKKFDPKKLREEFEWYLATRHLGNKLT